MPDEQDRRNEKEHELTAADNDLGRELVDRLTAVPGTDSIGMEVLRRHRSYLGKMDLSIGRWSLSREAVGALPNMEWLQAPFIGAPRGNGRGRTSKPATLSRIATTSRVAASDSTSSGITGSPVAPSPAGSEAGSDGTKIARASSTVPTDSQLSDVPVGRAVAAEPTHSFVALRSESGAVHVVTDSHAGHGSDEAGLPAHASSGAPQGGKPPVESADGTSQSPRVPVTAGQPATVHGGPPIYQRSKAQRSTSPPRISQAAAGSEASPSTVQRKDQPQPVFAQRKISSSRRFASVQESVAEVSTPPLPHGAAWPMVQPSADMAGSATSAYSQAHALPAEPKPEAAQPTTTTPATSVVHRQSAGGEPSGIHGITQPFSDGAAAEPSVQLAGGTPQAQQVPVTAKQATTVYGGPPIYQRSKAQRPSSPPRISETTTGSQASPSTVQREDRPQPVFAQRKISSSRRFASVQESVAEVSTPPLPHGAGAPMVQPSANMAGSATSAYSQAQALPADPKPEAAQPTTMTPATSVVHRQSAGGEPSGTPGDTQPFSGGATSSGKTGTDNPSVLLKVPAPRLPGSSTYEFLRSRSSATPFAPGIQGLAESVLSRHRGTYVTHLSDVVHSANSGRSARPIILSAAPLIRPATMDRAQERPTTNAVVQRSHEVASVGAYDLPVEQHNVQQSAASEANPVEPPISWGKTVELLQKSHEQSRLPVMRSAALPLPEPQSVVGVRPVAVSSLNQPTGQSSAGLSQPVGEAATSGQVNLSRPHTAHLHGSHAAGERERFGASTSQEESAGPVLIHETHREAPAVVTPAATPHHELQPAPLLHADSSAEPIPAVSRAKADSTSFHSRADVVPGVSSFPLSLPVGPRQSIGASADGSAGFGLIHEAADGASEVATSVVAKTGTTRYSTLQPADVLHADRFVLTAPAVSRVKADSTSLPGRADDAPGMSSIGISTQSATDLYLPRFASRAILERSTGGDRSREAFGRGPGLTLHHAARPASMQHFARVAQNTSAVHRAADGTIFLSPAAPTTGANPVPSSLPTATGVEQPIGASTQITKGVDIAQLANRVYDLLVRRLASERQRRGA